MRREDEIDILRSKDQTTYLLPRERDGTARIVQFRATGWRGIYALGVGTLEEEMLPNKVLETGLSEEYAAKLVLMTMISFTDRFPRRHIIFLGHTPAHQRRYRMLIGRYYEQLNALFILAGMVSTPNGGSLEVPFDSRREFLGFTFRRRLDR